MHVSHPRPYSSSALRGAERRDDPTRTPRKSIAMVSAILVIYKIVTPFPVESSKYIM